MGKVLAGKSATKIAKLIVVHDDLDLALGTFKISFNKGKPSETTGRKAKGATARILRATPARLPKVMSRPRN